MGVQRAQADIHIRRSIGLVPKRDNDSEFIRHIPCPKCGSSDANSEYTDGHEHCFHCGYHKAATGEKRAEKPMTAESPFGPAKPVAGLILDGQVEALRARQITEATCAHFGYTKATYNGKTVQVAPYYDEAGKLIAQKVRFANKKFIWLGDQADALPFGAKAWPKAGRMIVVTEGEIDALTMSQVQGNKWPVVSISCGAGPQIKKWMAANRDYFLGFEKVVLMFDMDEPGRRAASEAAAVLGARAHIAELPGGYKDANEMLLAGKSAELIDAMWKAQPYRPEGVVDLLTLQDAVKEDPVRGISLPWPALTARTFGLRRGEIWSFGAATGAGKSAIFLQLMHHLATVEKVPVAGFFLEQSVKETATRLAGVQAQKPLHVPDAGWTTEDIDAAFEAFAESGRVFLYDSFGNNTWDTIREKIEYLHHAEGVNYFFLDHLTALATWQEDERVALDIIMSEMGSLVKKLDITILLVSHLATPEGKPHEEGGRVMARHFRGSRSIGYWSHFMFGAERNQQAEDEDERNTTILRGLKDRFTGRSTGKTLPLHYDTNTGLLSEEMGGAIPLADSPFSGEERKEDF
ncbi:DNA directed DNA polymerase [Caudoviricetes sp.]|nr:DNA directed DNA polymerase [Caudoviricetes sp.]